MFLKISIGLANKRKDLEDSEFESIILEGELDDIRADAWEIIGILGESLVGLQKINSKLVSSLGIIYDDDDISGNGEGSSEESS